MDLAEIVSTFLRILPQAIVSGVALGSVYALIAQGYYVTFTTTETVNFAQGEFLMVGALTSYSAAGAARRELPGRAGRRGRADGRHGHGGGAGRDPPAAPTPSR